MSSLDTQSDAVAQVYARSVFELAKSEGGQSAVEEIAGELEAIIELTLQNPQFAEFLRSAVISDKDRTNSVRAIFEGRVSDIVLRFLLVLSEKGRLGRLGGIATAYDELLQESYGRVEVDVFTASPIDQKQLDAIKERLRQALGKEPVMHAYTQPEMVGGLKLQVGDQLIDASVSTRLRKLQEQLASQGAAQVRSRARSLFDDA